MSKRLEILERSLAKVKEKNRSLWDTYGSELCAGEMIEEERVIEEKIKHLKKETQNDEI